MPFDSGFAMETICSTHLSLLVVSLEFHRELEAQVYHSSINEVLVGYYCNFIRIEKAVRATKELELWQATVVERVQTSL